MKYFVLLLFLFVAAACQRPLQKDAAVPVNKFSDPEIRAIYTWQDERKTTALLPFLTHQNPVYRAEAALALASVQDKISLSALTNSLTDKAAAVRKAAAYALGQIGEAAEPGLLTHLPLETVPTVKAEMLEALGKCASQKGLDFLTSFITTDQIIKAGQAWGLYRTNAKKLDYNKTFAIAAQMLAASNSASVRLGAAQFLARTPTLSLHQLASQLQTTAQSDSLAEVRMAATQALGKIKRDQITPTLLHLAAQDPDYRVQINAIRALSYVDFSKTKEVVYKNLQHTNPNTALVAAEFLLANALGEDANRILEEGKKITNWRVRATLWGAALKLHPQKNLVEETIRKIYSQTSNVYEKAALLSALGTYIEAYPFIQKEAFSGVSPVLASSGMQALVDIRTNKAFPEALKSTFAALFQRAIESGDMAMIGIAAGALQNPALNFREAYPDFTFLKTVQNKLTLPQDMETYLELEKAIHFFQGTAPAAATPQNPFNHPIDWNLVQKIPRNQKVRLLTNKGSIMLQLLVEEAPGSVANFVALTQTGFYNGKNFHRVVPNFVVQGGDPRGDGYGGTDYSLRSEFANLRYASGAVGMASAGKDTESCQWFITHSPTPHLDGRYTIFARVIAGMEIVHQLEVGDKIIKAELIN